jgi:hypothetical protein
MRWISRHQEPVQKVDGQTPLLSSRNGDLNHQHQGNSVSQKEMITTKDFNGFVTSKRDGHVTIRRSEPGISETVIRFADEVIANETTIIAQNTKLT